MGAPVFGGQAFLGGFSGKPKRQPPSFCGGSSLKKTSMWRLEIEHDGGNPTPAKTSRRPGELNIDLASESAM